jgi:hypothetical protein
VVSFRGFPARDEVEDGFGITKRVLRIVKGVIEDLNYDETKFVIYNDKFNRLYWSDINGNQ